MSVGVKGGVPFILPFTPTGSCVTDFELQKSYNNLTPSTKGVMLRFEKKCAIMLYNATVNMLGRLSAALINGG